MILDKGNINKIISIDLKSIKISKNRIEFVNEKHVFVLKIYQNIAFMATKDKVNEMKLGQRAKENVFCHDFSESFALWTTTLYHTSKWL